MRKSKSKQLFSLKPGDVAETEAQSLYNNSIQKRIDEEQKRRIQMHHKRIGNTVLDNPHQTDQIKIDHSKANVEALKAKCGINSSVEEPKLLPFKQPIITQNKQDKEMIIEVGPATTQEDDSPPKTHSLL